MGMSLVDRQARSLHPAGSLESFLEDHEALTASLRAGSRGFEAGLSDFLTGYALMRTERLGGAVLDRRGQILFANDQFRKLFDEAGPDPDAVATVLASRESRMVHDIDAGRPPSAYAIIDQARAWALPADVRAALDLPGAKVAVLAVAAISGGDALSDACRAFGLTPLQTRVAVGLVRTGDVRGAAREAGATYETARKVVAEAMRRVGAPRLTGLIERLVRLSFGVWPEGRDGAAVLCDVWGLSERQAALALRLSEGLTRAEAARAAGVSEGTAKKDLEVVFSAMDVRTGAALARVVTEARALALLTQATKHDVHGDEEFLEPLGLIVREDGSQIAYSDYGPRSGRPVLVLHSSTASRPVPLRFVRALQAAGYRPLSLDRPGFGLSDGPADRADHRADPFKGACADVALLCRHLKLPRVDIAARGGAQVALALQRTHPELLGKVLLVNPDPPSAGGGGHGPLALIKETFLRHPDVIEKMAGLWVASLSGGQAMRIMTSTMEGSPPDAALMSDPRNVADYGRSWRLFLTGRIAGYVDEQVAMARWTMDEPMPGLSHWRILLGEHDTLHDPARTLAFWREALPDTPIEVVRGAGRFLVMSHAELAAKALTDAPESPR